MKLESDEYGRIVFSTDQAVQYYINRDRTLLEEGCKGGVLLFEDDEGEQKHSWVGVNRYKTDSYEGCLNSARIKIRQLHENPKHLSTAQDRDPEKGYLLGGIQLPEYRAKIALAGLPEIANEACLLNGLYYAHVVHIGFVQTILEYSHNKVLFMKIWNNAF